MSHTRSLAMFGLGAALIVAGGCTTKKYVRQQTTPLINHVNQLDAETAKNSNEIRKADQSTKQGLQQVNQASEQALQQAKQVQGQAQQVGQQLNQTSNRIQSLDQTVANLDNYKQTSAATVHFGFDKSNLTPSAKQTLAGVAQQMQQNPHGILEVEGYTDSTGPVAYNNKHSQRRADSVVRYLELQNVPPHRIYLIGLGENQPVASNHTLAGRKENRRVDLRVLTDNLGNANGSGQ